MLTPCFLHARKLFFGSLHDARNAIAAKSAVKVNEGGYDKEEGIYIATSVILLWEPNHLTAINWRKRYLLRQTQEVIDAELCFLESLLTSPLTKHTKAPMLWSHRLWLLRTFHCWNCGSEGDGKGAREERKRDEKVEVWRNELKIVMRAGQRHPRNYYAWEYARDVFRLLIELREGSAKGEGEGKERIIVAESAERVWKWCFSHPRDISGWSFLVWLLEKLAYVAGGEIDGSADTVRDVIYQTEEFVRKYEWEGESIDWFLVNAARLKKEGTKLRK